MKILYAIQGTGNGHLSRARDIIPILQKKGELDILVSGIQADVDLPYEVKYRFNGLSFIFGKRGGVNMLKTYRKSDLKRLYKEIKSLPVEEYDLILNDFEPVSAWACKARHIDCIGLSHQAAVISKHSPKPKKKEPLGRAILYNYAPVSEAYGFHFKEYDKNIFTPVIRGQIRNAKPTDNGHYTVYLPAYSDKRIIGVLSKITDVNWEVFSKHTKMEYHTENVHVRPVSNEAFIESFISCKGVLCGAGFETPAEALFLKKKLMVIPMKGQYEQQCNAVSAAELGVPVIKSLKPKFEEEILKWTANPQLIEVDYPDITENIIDRIIAEQLTKPVKGPKELNEHSFNKLKAMIRSKILKEKE